jgi:hypothetical protein
LTRGMTSLAWRRCVGSGGETLSSCVTISK